MLRRIWDWWTSDHVVLTQPGVDRMFMGCAQCGALRRYADVMDKRRGVNCAACGHTRIRPKAVSFTRAAWEVLVVGYLWRHLICRRAHQQDWDPRMPYRRTEFEGFGRA